jgi:hypothetical protein
MKIIATWALAVPIFAISVPSSDAADRHPGTGSAGLSVNDVVEAGRTKEYLDPDMVVLTSGFWAKAGSDVTVRTALDFLQMSDQPHNPPPPPTGRAAAPFNPDCPEDTIYSPCRSGDRGADSSVEVDIGLNMASSRFPLPNPASYYAITGIEIIEASDNPCWIKLYGDMVDPRFSKDQNGRWLAEYRIYGCASGRSRFVDLRPTERMFVRALQVCVHHQPNVADLHPFIPRAGRLEIKGLRIRAGLVSSMNEHVTALDKPEESIEKPEEFRGPNCPDHKSADRGTTPIVGAGNRGGWHNWSTCPEEGQLATGITVYYDKDKAFSAMRIKCKYVRLLSGPAPVKDEHGLW